MRQIDPGSVPTRTFDRVAIKRLVTPDRTGGGGPTVGEVILLPGKIHDRHNHPDSEETFAYEWFVAGDDCS